MPFYEEAIGGEGVGTMTIPLTMEWWPSVEEITKQGQAPHKSTNSIGLYKIS